MHDPTTGKPFYVDHERKITQWTRPVAEKPMESSLRPASMANSNYNNFKQQQQSNNYNSSSSVSSSSTSLLRSYQQEAAYYSQPVRNTDVDLAGLPAGPYLLWVQCDKIVYRSLFVRD